MLAACGPASQTTPTAAPAAPAATSAPAAAPPAQPTAALKPAATAPGPTIAPAAGQPKQGGRVIWGDITDIKTLNPVISTDTSSTEVINRIYAPLLTVDAKTGEVERRLTNNGRGLQVQGTGYLAQQED
jgi:ABC-type transport system substrate-binding protein